MNLRDNDHVSLHALDGFLAHDLAGALEEAAAISQATHCKKYLFSLSLNPPLEGSVSEAEFEAVIARAGRDLGLAGQPKAVVFHEKNGRRHAHVVWSRIDAGQMKAIQLPHFKRKLMAISRDLYLEHGWEMPAGFRDTAQRDPNRFTHAEASQAKRAERDPAEMKAMFRGCWDASDSQAGFAAALAENGFVVARGDRRGFVAVDAAGKIWSLSRWCGVKSKDLQRKLSAPGLLPDVSAAQARATQLRSDATAKERNVRDDAYRTALSALVDRQRTARASLLEAQRSQEGERLKDRPNAFRIAFLKATGRYEAFVQRRAGEAETARAEAARARQALIDQHLQERRAFERAHVPTRTPPERQESFTPRQKPTTLTKAQVLRQPDLVLAEISKTKASFTRTDVLRALSRWIDDPAALSKSADAALSAPEAVRLSSDQAARYTKRDYQRAEAQLSDAAQRLSASKTVKVTAQNLNGALANQNKTMKRAFGGTLSDEQTQAIRSVLGSERLAQVVGLAGAGKSTMLATAAEAWQRQGVTVHGAALAGKAADGLQASAGISSRTLASLELSWENGNTLIKQGDVLVVDEAGMIGMRQMARVAAKIDAIGAKLVLVGDPDQLQPIEAGTPFRDLVARHGAAELREVRRQKAEWQRAATQDLATGETANAVDAYRHAGSLNEYIKQDEAIEALAERFAMDALSGTSDGTTRLAMAHKRRDVHKLNQSIRAALRPAEVAAQDVELQTETGKRSFGATDRIVFTRNDTDLGVKNGMLGTVTQAQDGKLVVDLDSAEAREVTFDPSTYQSFDHGYAVTIHKSQGVTVDQAYVLGSRSMDKHLAYVALTRHRDDVQLFHSMEDRPAWTRSPTPQPDRHYARDGPSLG